MQTKLVVLAPHGKIWHSRDSSQRRGLSILVKVHDTVFQKTKDGQLAYGLYSLLVKERP